MKNLIISKVNIKVLIHCIIVLALLFVKPFMFGVFLSISYFGFMNYVYIYVKKQIPDEFVYFTLFYMFLISGIQ